MIIKQVTVIVENKEGKLKEVMDIISGQGINVHALSMADTVTRLIVDDPEGVKELLEDQGYEVHLTEVISVKVPSRPGSIIDMLHRMGSLLGNEALAICANLSYSEFIDPRLLKR